MNDWSKKTLELVHNEDYLDKLQAIYSHEDGVRTVSTGSISAIRKSFESKDETTLINQLLDLGKFPYKDSYVAFLRKDRTAIERNPATVKRICDRIFDMGIDNLIAGITQPKEANTRRGNQFRNWMKMQYKAVDISAFKKSKGGIVILEASELDAKDFCNRHLHVGITKRPDIVAKVDSKYVIGEAKFLSSAGGNQDRAFDDGIKLATNSDGTAYKVFVLDGVFWIEEGSEQYKRIDHSTASIFSALLLNQFLTSL